MQTRADIISMLGEGIPAPGKAGKLSSPSIATIWADEISIDIEGTGLVDGLLPLTGMSVEYGESGAGKTFCAVDLAGHVATGMPWRGREVEQGIVVYIAAESPESIKRRLVAWKLFHGV